MISKTTLSRILVDSVSFFIGAKSSTATVVRLEETLNAVMLDLHLDGDLPSIPKITSSGFSGDITLALEDCDLIWGPDVELHETSVKRLCCMIHPFLICECCQEKFCDSHIFLRNDSCPAVKMHPYGHRWKHYA